MRPKFLIGLLFGYLIIIIADVTAFCQSDLSADILDSYFSDDALDIDELQELIYAYRDNPLVWETCRIKDLRALPLNDHLKSQLIELKRHQPKSLNLKALVKDTIFTASEIEAISYFIDFSVKRSKPSRIVNFLSLKKQEVVSLQKSLQRARCYSPQGWFTGIIVENDSDEPILCDYWNISLRSPKYFNRLEVLGGAYRLQWGQGLLFANNLMSGRSADATGNLRASRSGVSNYLGADENRFLFGSAAQYTSGHFKLTPFISYHRLDATFDTNGTVKNLRSDGLHISSSQLRAKDALLETSGGTSLLGEWDQGSAGILVYAANYATDLSALNEHRNVSGLSFLHNYERNDWTINGEWAVQNHGSKGLIQNLHLNRDRVSFCTGWRYIEPGFFAPLGNPFRKFSSISGNETGLYSALKIKLPARWHFNGYVDFFRELKSAEPGVAPRNGRESLWGFSRQARNSDLVEALYKVNRYYHTSLPQQPRDYQLKLHLRHSFNTSFTGEIRTTFRWNDSIPFAEGSQALGIVGKISVSKFTRVIVGSTHYFTSSSDLKIYFYEPGLPFRFNMTLLTGTGQRYFLIISRRIGSNCELAGAVYGRSNASIPTNDNSFDFSGDFQLTFDL
ncbi:MAG TPA: hypothetical protein P5268_07325 [Candidatus Marinimicrobia bacterium]|nr:hypothetical protein [Candidatus Neomarinimicrobiota bacterium]HRS51097.1 hypothetical protein [Candidatus Neomarinimicrobiota bacterium]HRU92824.1 hypothetical protein [Candidatus Neomarinimicrobiota bacterium]